MILEIIMSTCQKIDEDTAVMGMSLIATRHMEPFCIKPERIVFGEINNGTEFSPWVSQVYYDMARDSIVMRCLMDFSYGTISYEKGDYEEESVQNLLATYSLLIKSGFDVIFEGSDEEIAFLERRLIPGFTLKEMEEMKGG